MGNIVNRLANEFVLGFTLPESLRPIYSAWEIDIPDHNGNDSFELPIPATYIVDTDGKQYTERELSIHYKANFTPSLVFYDIDGTPVFRLRGFYPPYKFRAALQYVAEEFYKKETFSDYFARANPGEYFLQGGLTERDFFLPPPYDLKATRNNGKPTAVFFEQGNCHACDLLHSAPLSKELSLQEIKKMNVIQLNMWDNTPIITPKGKKTTAKEWARSLDIFYAPSIIFFDSEGAEIIRVDSVTYFYRLWGVLDYVNQEGYKQTTDYQNWRLQQRKLKQRTRQMKHTS